MPTTPRLGTIIAERQLVVGDSTKVVRVSIGAPRPAGDGAPWACPFRIAGAGISRAGNGYGEDSMQALADALEGIRHVLDGTGLQLGWNLGPGAVWDGETGFTRAIPFALGPTFRRRMERLIERELAREVQRLKRRATRRSRRNVTAKAR